MAVGMREPMVDFTDLHLQELAAFQEWLDGDASLDEWQALSAASGDLVVVIGMEYLALPISCD
jgi:hypothetical protein